MVSEGASLKKSKKPIFSSSIDGTQGIAERAFFLDVRFFGGIASRISGIQSRCGGDRSAEKVLECMHD